MCRSNMPRGDITLKFGEVKVATCIFSGNLFTYLVEIDFVNLKIE